jgi:hypothetical protein
MMFFLSGILLDLNVIIIRFMKNKKFYLILHIFVTFLINFFIWVDIVIRKTQS